MAVDPLTGQTPFNNQTLDLRYAGFLDPSQAGNILAGQQQAQQQGQLAQALMNRGYIPNSGFGGALAQMVQSLIGAKMLQSSQEKMAGLASQQFQAANEAEQKKHAQEQADKQADVVRAIAQATGIKKGDLQAQIDLAPGLNAAEVAKQSALVPVEAAKAGAVANAQLPAQTALEKLRAAASVAAAQAGAATGNLRLQTKENPDGSLTVIQPKPDGSFTTANVALPEGAKTKQDVAAVGKRIPILQDQVNAFDIALQQAQEMKAKMSAGGYSAGGIGGLYNAYAPTPLQTTGGQELGTDAGNLILAAQKALQGTGNRGSVAQLRILQTSKPNTALDAQANQNAIDKITAELQQARTMPAAELEHYGAGGTPTTWAKASAELAAKSKQPAADSQHPADISALLDKYGQ